MWCQHGCAWEGKWRRNWRMEWVASTLHTTSEHGVSSITFADAHTSAGSSRLNWRPCRFKWNLSLRRKTKSCFCACAITFQTQSNSTVSYSGEFRTTRDDGRGEKQIDHLTLRGPCIVSIFLIRSQQNATLHSFPEINELCKVASWWKHIRKIQIEHIKQASLSNYDDLCIGRHLLGLYFVTSLKSNLCTVLTTWSPAEKKKRGCINSQAQNTTALQPQCICNCITLLTGHK